MNAPQKEAQEQVDPEPGAQECPAGDDPFSRATLSGITESITDLVCTNPVKADEKIVTRLSPSATPNGLYKKTHNLARVPTTLSSFEKKVVKNTVLKSKKGTKVFRLGLK